MAEVGYSKLGRALNLAPSRWGEVGGDNEPPVLLNKLARAHPEHTFWVLGRNQGDVPQDIGFPDNVRNPWAEWRPVLREGMKGMKSPLSREEKMRLIEVYDALTYPTFVEMDHHIVWTGQHGTSNQPIPMVGGEKITNPQDAFVNYASYIIRGLNGWRDTLVDPASRAEFWLCPDPRNYLKCRDLKWPPEEIASQVDWHKNEKHYRWGDAETDPARFDCTWAEPGVWKAEHRYRYSGLELSGIPSSITCTYDWSDRKRFGMLVNENRAYVNLDRLTILKDWVLPLQPDFIHGKWSKKSLEELDLQITPVEWFDIFDQIRTVKSTFTTPASGSNWATTKPWEAFAVGTVCFFHPDYDTQDHILGRPGFEDLKSWLRIVAPQDLQARVDIVHEDRETYTWLAQEQRRLFDQAMDEAQIVNYLGSNIGR